MRMKTETSPKEKLFQTAARLFYQRGYRSIGVDTIASESGIGKMTLIVTTSKDALIGYLQDSNGLWKYFEQITQAALTARGKLLAFFEALQEYALSPVCYGCPFLNIATEYPGTDYPGHQAAIDHKQAVRARFSQLANEAGASQPEALANALILLMDGAYMAARMFGSSPNSPAANLAEAARQVIEAQCDA
jgi:AcrR family transcriptional regulator